MSLKHTPAQSVPVSVNDSHPSPIREREKKHSMNLLCLVKLEFVNIDDFCVFIHLLGEKKPSVKHRETIVNDHYIA